MFTLSYCPFCKEAKELMEQNGAKYYNIEVDTASNKNDILTMLKNKTTWSKFPQIFVNGQFIGGLTALKDYTDDQWTKAK